MYNTKCTFYEGVRKGCGRLRVRDGGEGCLRDRADWANKEKTTLFIAEKSVTGPYFVRMLVFLVRGARHVLHVGQRFGAGRRSGDGVGGGGSGDVVSAKRERDRRVPIVIRAGQRQRRRRRRDGRRRRSDVVGSRRRVIAAANRIVVAVVRPIVGLGRPPRRAAAQGLDGMRERRQRRRRVAPFRRRRLVQQRLEPGTVVSPLRGVLQLQSHLLLFRVHRHAAVVVGWRPRTTDAGYQHLGAGKKKERKEKNK